MRQRIATAGIALALGMTAFVALPAEAATVTVHPIGDVYLQNGAGPTGLLQVTLGLAAGESRLFTGRLQATNFIADNVEQKLTIRCDSTSDYGQTSENHRGPGTPAGGNYPVAGQLATTTNWIFTAPRAGIYACTMYGAASTTSNLASPGQIVLDALAATSYLKYSTTADVGAGQWLPNPCTSKGEKGCTYLTSPSTAFELYGDGAPGLNWSAAPGAVAIDAVGDATVTTCYSGTGSCTVDGVRKSHTTGAALDSSLEALQIDSGGHTCATTVSPTLRTTVLDDSHHQKLHHRISRVPINTGACGNSRRFVLRVRVTWVSGQPVKLDGAQGLVQLSNGIALNLFQ